MTHVDGNLATSGENTIPVNIPTTLTVVEAEQTSKHNTAPKTEVFNFSRFIITVIINLFVFAKE